MRYKFFRVKVPAIVAYSRNCLQEGIPSQWSKQNRDIVTEFVLSRTFSHNLLSKIFQESKRLKATRQNSLLFYSNNVLQIIVTREITMIKFYLFSCFRCQK